VGARVSGVHGPSAVTFALALSGLPADRFVFEGFLPRRGRARSERMASIASENRTVVLFCSPTRLGSDLTDLAAASTSDRDCVVSRELTKLYEEVWRGTLGEAAAHWSENEARGEVTVVIGPAPPAEPSTEAALAAVADLVASGVSRSEAVRRVAGQSGVSRRLLYEAAVTDDEA
jgi:16S rRNA (cytidine1402-2'-O)-methyltransferase